MRIVFATDLSDANQAAIRSRNCLECLANIGVREVHLLTVVPDNVSSGLPGIDVATDARAALGPQRQVFESEGSETRHGGRADVTPCPVRGPRDRVPNRRRLR